MSSTTHLTVREAVNLTLHEVRELVAETQASTCADPVAAAVALARKVDLIDNWMSRGFDLPDAWRENR